MKRKTMKKNFETFSNWEVDEKCVRNEKEKKIRNFTEWRIRLSNPNPTIKQSLHSANEEIIFLNSKLYSNNHFEDNEHWTNVDFE